MRRGLPAPSVGYVILVGSDGSDGSNEDALDLARDIARMNSEPMTVAEADRSSPGCLSDLARELSAGTIVVGSTVAGELLRIAPCTVAVAPRGYAKRYANRLERVVAAFDGPSEADSRADLLVTDLHGYGLLARMADCPVMVVPGRKWGVRSRRAGNLTYEAGRGSYIDTGRRAKS